MYPTSTRHIGRRAHRVLFLALASNIGLLLAPAPSEARAAVYDLTGSLWICTRVKDASQFVITFYAGGGVGGGELQKRKVSPYVFDATGLKEGQWPGHWEQQGEGFAWEFPDQHMRIAGTVTGNARGARLTGVETGSGGASAITCRSLVRLPRIGEGLVIPKDGHFIDLEDGEGTLKVPAGISLPVR